MKHRLPGEGGGLRAHAGCGAGGFAAPPSASKVACSKSAVMRAKPKNPSAAAMPNPVAAPAPSPATVLPVPEATLELLLGVEGVAAVGWCPPDTDQGAVLRAHAGADAQALQREFSAWCGQPRPGAETEQLLVRWSDRLTLLRPADAAGSLYYLASVPGFLNETWLRVQVDAALQPPAGAA